MRFLTLCVTKCYFIAVLLHTMDNKILVDNDGGV